MGSFGEGILGGVGGFLSTGSPLGIATGFLGGIFGSDEEQVQTNTYTPLSGAQQQMTGQASNQLTQLMQSLSPDARASMVSQLQGQFSSVLGQQATDAFNIQSGRARANMGRTGGGPSSVLNTQLAQLGTERTKALAGAEMQATSMAQQFGGQQFRDLSGTAMGLGGMINQAEGTRRLASSTGSVPGGNMGNLLGGIGAGLTDPNSFFSQNQSSFGAFGAPIFGSAAKPVDTGRQGPSITGVPLR